MKEIKKMKKDSLIFKEEYKDYAIVIENLYFSYDKDNNINGISLKIKKGEKVALLGHNGSGKTTLLKLIDGILIQKSGNIYINGYLLTDDSSYKVRKNIGLVFQNPDSQFIGNTAKDDIIFSLENECVDPSKMDEIVDSVLKQIDMFEFKDRDPASLSGGQKQRLNLASIFALNKDILLFDEAKSMIDPKARIDIDNIISKKKEENKDLTIISITHDIEEVDFYDRIILLENGKVEYDGDKNTLFNDEALLNKVHLKAPFYYELKSKLNDDFNLDDVNSLQELLDKLCQ